VRASSSTATSGRTDGRAGRPLPPGPRGARTRERTHHARDPGRGSARGRPDFSFFFFLLWEGRDVATGFAANWPVPASGLVRCSCAPESRFATGGPGGTGTRHWLTGPEGPCGIRRAWGARPSWPTRRPRDSGGRLARRSGPGQVLKYLVWSQRKHGSVRPRRDAALRGALWPDRRLRVPAQSKRPPPRCIACAGASEGPTVSNRGWKGKFDLPRQPAEGTYTARRGDHT